jgi:hypothetical protein
LDIEKNTANKATYWPFKLFFLFGTSARGAFVYIDDLSATIGAAKSASTVWADGFTAFLTGSGGRNGETMLSGAAAFITASAAMTG